MSDVEADAATASAPDAPTPDAGADEQAAPAEPIEPEVEHDEAREAILAAFAAELGDGIVASHLRPHDDLLIRVSTEAWRTAGETARRQLGFGYFCFLSAIDWRPSPFGRYEDAEVDRPLAAKLEAPYELTAGDAGSDTRFQVFARVRDVRDNRTVTLRADVPDDAMTVETWVGAYAGADWHERETWEMFGIDFAGHPGLRHIYLPADFEGFPLRKDFPLLARVVKPWPGIVDVEPMPGEAATEADADADPVDAEAAT
ncbi:MAG: NADH-quinone oxidoreductase subunit C [Acidimicrobiales bacterium]